MIKKYKNAYETDAHGYKETKVPCLLELEGGIMIEHVAKIHRRGSDIYSSLGEKMVFVAGQQLRGWGRHNCSESLVCGNLHINPTILSKALRRISL